MEGMQTGADYRPEPHLPPSRAYLGASPQMIAGILLLCVVMAVLLVVSPKYLLVFVAALLVVGLTIAYPYAGLLIMVAFIFLRPGERVPALHALHIARLQAALLICVWLVQRHLHRKPALVRHRLGTTFVAGAAVIMLSAITAVWKHPSFAYLAEYLYMLVLFFATIDLVDSERRLKGYIWLMIGLMTCLSIEQLLGLGESTGLAGEVLREGGMGAALADTNEFGLAILFFLPFAFYSALSVGNRWLRIGLFGLSGLLVVSIIATGSRGAVVGFLALCIALWSKSKHKFVVGLGLAVLVVALWFAAPSAYRVRVASILNYQQEENATVRRDAWKAGLSMFMHHPLLGVGPTNFPIEYGNQTGSKWIAAHSLYMQALAELGTVGVVWALFLIVYIFRTARASQRRLHKLGGPLKFPWATANAVEASFISFLVAGAFLSCLYYSYVWLLAGLAVILDLQTRKLSAPVEVVAAPAVHVYEQAALPD